MLIWLLILSHVTHATTILQYNKIQKIVSENNSSNTVSDFWIKTTIQ